MARAIVAVELVYLAVLLERGLVHIHLLGRWGAVVIAEEAEERAVQVLRVIHRRDRAHGVQVFLAHHHTASPEVDACVEAGGATRREQGMPPA